MKQVVAMMLACGALLLMRAATASSDDTPPMTSDSNNTVILMKYKFSYELPDGTEGKEEGILKNVGTDAEVLSVTGSFEWQDYAHGSVRTLYYVADEKGFRIIGESGIAGEVHPHVVASLLGGK